MPRQPRLVLPDLPVHVVHRANDRMPCFLAEGDYLVYLALLRQLVERLRCTVHAYCIMTNHIHLLLTPDSTAACSRLMGSVAQRYATYFNRKHQRTGTLWEGRFRSCVVESARYVLGCYRYIELNPVRAGMVGHPEGYLWSSYGANSGALQDPLVVPHPELVAIGTGQYRALVMQTVEPELLRDIREATSGGYPLGSQSFMTTLHLPPGRKVMRGRPGRRSDATREQEPGQSVPGTDLFTDLFSEGGAS
jgi:putative transposase